MRTAKPITPNMLVVLRNIDARRSWRDGLQAIGLGGYSAVLRSLIERGLFDQKTGQLTEAGREAIAKSPLTP